MSALEIGLPERDTPREPEMPCEVEAEYRILGAITSYPEMMVQLAEILPRGDLFYYEAHQAYWDAALDLLRAGEPVDLLTLHDELHRRRAAAVPFAAAALVLPTGSFAGQFEHIFEAAERAGAPLPLAEQVEHDAHLVKRAAVFRHLLRDAHELAVLAYEKDPRAGEVAQRLAELAAQEFSSAEGAALPEERIESTDPVFWQRNAELSDERQRRSWAAGVVTLPTDGTDKTIINAVRTLLEYRDCLTSGRRTPVHLESFGRHLHIGDATLGKRLREGHKLGLWGYESKYGKDGKKHSELWSKPLLLTPWLAQWPEQTRGGVRPGAGRPPTCPGCGSEDLVDTRVCRNCGNHQTLYDAQHTALTSPDVRIVDADPDPVPTPTPYSPSLNLYGETHSSPYSPSLNLYGVPSSERPDQAPVCIVCRTPKRRQTDGSYVLACACGGEREVSA
jgi:DnaB-like helicase N terminal domain